MAHNSTIQRHQQVVNEFKRLSAITENGVKKYTTDLVIMRVSKKTFYTPKTIVQILKKHK